MMELQIKGQAYQFKFGFGFMREIRQAADSKGTERYTAEYWFPDSCRRYS